MSDNLKVAKECGAFVKYQLTSALGKVPAEVIFNVSELDDYTSRILASQQAEIAKLKEENARQHKEILVYHESRLALINEKEAMAKQLSASQARIKASQEQEPAIHVGYSHAYAETIVRNTEEKMASAWCSRYDSYYSQPQIPPELAELQRELTKSVREACSLAVENAELRKLLESKVPEDVEKDAKRWKWYRDNGNRTCGAMQLEAWIDLHLDAQPKEPKQSHETDLDEALRRQ